MRSHANASVRRRKSKTSASTSAADQHPYNYALRRHLTCLLLLQQISSKKPALIAVFIDPSESAGSGFLNASILPVSPLLSGPNQAFPIPASKSH
jgi:hypothetical protein